MRYGMKPDAGATSATMNLSKTNITGLTWEEAIATVASLDDEIAALVAWKESALAVEREWDEQAIAKLLGGTLGRSCRKIIAEKVPELVAENATLRAQLAEARKAMAEYRYRPRHSGMCLSYLPGKIGTVTKESCRCTPDEKAYSAVLETAAIDAALDGTKSP